ncbi:GSH2 [Candida pseudojiufengensis]|uniref:GSH2 n=1 Tax=Candida pseudojiufengensis TaxID=497109 RepID=UPI0022258EFC|nr:GSH2 [Candida pseudojiufengensis]KAI5962662.1 GSH2 [Candida pseudojiufengensis]
MDPIPFPQLSHEQENELKLNAQQWSLSNGLVMYPPNFETFQTNVAPITLFPTPIPKTSFQQALNVQKIYNELYINLITKHKSWLIEVLEELAKFDPNFTGKLFEIYKESIKDEVLQPISLGIFRSDYMIDSNLNDIKQIEFNTVSVSFGGLSTKIGQLQNFLNSTGFYDNKYNFKYYEDESLPISNSIEKIAEGLAQGNFYYNDKQENEDTIVLFVVQPNERNCFDQRLIEYELFNKHKIKAFRATLEEIEEVVTINSDKAYIKSTTQEISVVYYRSGYGPGDYEVNPAKSWNARLILEKSKAIKCPSILTQLSGSKKIQQLLTDHEILKKILPDLSNTDFKELISTFVNIYPFDDSELGKKAKKLAFESPEKFVLKPQREGGGNNIYKKNIPDFLKSIPESEWGAYILMELITPKTFKNKIMRNKDIYNENIISELGIFGNILFNETTGEILKNENAGWLLRSKFETSDEGGVAAGFGCVDNIYLY